MGPKDFEKNSSSLAANDKDAEYCQQTSSTAGVRRPAGRKFAKLSFTGAEGGEDGGSGWCGPESSW